MHEGVTESVELRAAAPFASIPTLRGGLPIAGHWPAVVQAPLHFLERAAQVGPIVRFHFGPLRAVLLHDPGAIQQVLQNSPKTFRKSRNYASLKEVIGEGLLTSEGDFWRRQRKLAQPAFHHARLRGLVRVMGEITEQMLERWRRWPDGAPLDAHREMMRVTLRIAGLTLFGADLDRDARDVAEALEVTMHWANAAVEEPFRPPAWVPTPANRRFHRALATLDRLVIKIIEERRSARAEREDLLDMLMAATDESGAMTDRQLRDEILTSVLAGHETTANAMTWTFLMLSRHPRWAKAAAEEARAVLGERTLPEYEDLPKLEVCERIVNEVLRLYPPAYEFEREPIEDQVLAGHHIPAGTIVMIAPWTLHRHGSFWDEPHRFDPHRWLPERAASRPRYAYLPFGDGPRICIGKAFAMMETKLMLAMILREARVEIDPAAEIEIEPSVTLRPRGGMPARYRRTR